MLHCVVDAMYCMYVRTIVTYVKGLGMYVHTYVHTHVRMWGVVWYTVRTCMYDVHVCFKSIVDSVCSMYSTCMYVVILRKCTH